MDVQGPIWYRTMLQFSCSGDASPKNPVIERSIMTFKGTIPPNVAGTPAWNLILHHENASGSAGRVLMRVAASAFASGDTPSALTVIEPNTLLGVGASGDHNRSVLSASNYDSLVPVAASEHLVVELSRMPVRASGDTLGSHWYLTREPLLKIDVT